MSKVVERVHASRSADSFSATYLNNTSVLTVHDSIVPAIDSAYETVDHDTTARSEAAFWSRQPR